MSVRKRTTPPVKQQLVTGSTVDDDPQMIGQMFDRIAAQVNEQTRNAAQRSSLTFDLVVGANKMNHGLGGKPRGVSVSPTVADATFAWAMTAADDKQATISVLNVAQPGAGLEFWR